MGLNSIYNHRRRPPCAEIPDFHQRSAAFSVAGDGKASNFAAGTADRFPAWGTSQIAVLPATSPTTYPAKNFGLKMV